MIKKPIILTGFIMVAIIAVCVIRTLPLNETGFEVPSEMEYAIVYSTGEDSPEQTQISYMGKDGLLLKNDFINGVTDKDCILYDRSSKTYNLFTHDRIYFSGKNTYDISNDEILTTYKFASTYGKDTVYNTGYIEKLDMYYKFIPHGLAYAEEELGYFDLITFYNNNKIYNVRIIESASVAVNQTSGEIYAFESDEKSGLIYEKVTYNKDVDKFNVKRNHLDLSYFLKKYGQEDGVFTIYKSIITSGKVFQTIGVGEEEEKEYIVEYSIDESTGNITYENAYQLDIKGDESLSYDTPCVIKNDIISYYSYIKPNKAIHFNMRTKALKYQQFLPKNAGAENLDYNMKVIDNKVYVLESLFNEEKFSIYKVDDFGKLEEQIKGNLPKSKLKSDCWIVDFYVK